MLQGAPAILKRQNLIVDFRMNEVQKYDANASIRRPTGMFKFLGDCGLNLGQT
jgi:hypothetical protein